MRGVRSSEFEFLKSFLLANKHIKFEVTLSEVEVCLKQSSTPLRLTVTQSAVEGCLAR